MNSTNIANEIYMAGDAIKLSTNEGIVLIGPGLSKQRNTTLSKSDNNIQEYKNVICVSRSGRILASENNKNSSKSIRLEFMTKRYIPLIDDYVVGIVNGRISEYYTVDINSKSLAYLPQLAFEGVTNRNRPNLLPGDLLFCKVRRAYPDAHPEITCVDEKTGKACGMGTIGNGGILLRVSPYYSRKLSTEKAYLFNIIGKEVEFESAIGVNGRIWIKAGDDRQSVAIYRLLREFEHKSSDLKQSKQRLIDYLIA
ncbi:hypothetical protein GJ496_004902 [Pomphorhynchus laevis]|nr:hypothetical protein GJ496_004902 [Pomphorhynchus laevis]